MLNPQPENNPVYLALVHHANQYVITNGYVDRQGISGILGLEHGLQGQELHWTGIFHLLRMHLDYQVPLHLHLSGTLIETLAWHYPESFSLIKQLGGAGLLELIGSTFSQNVMPFFSDEHNLRQINEELWLYRRHLGWEVTRVRTFWVPERVWDTEKMARVLRSQRLLNGGFSRVLLDDRLVYPVGRGYAGSARERFDRQQPLTEEAFVPWEIAGGHGLVMLPISKDLRYLIPPSHPSSWHRLSEIFRWLASSGSQNTIAVYGDDLERAAGVGGWDCLHLERYEQLLRWLVSNKWIRPVLIDSWASGHSAAGARRVEQGTFYELARLWKADEDYRGWYEDPHCFEHRQYLLAAEQALMESQKKGADRGLLEMGWKHLLHCSYETSWHKLHLGKLAEPMQLTPWAAALSSHARSCLIIAMAAEWSQQRDGAAHVELDDIDRDGELELTLKNDKIFAVFSPAQGGRLIYLFDLTGRSGRLVVGNVCDDWNLQEELNRYMDCPRNHPGAFAEVGHEHDPYQAFLSDLQGPKVDVTLRNVQPESRLCCAEKRLSLEASSGYLCVSYRLPSRVWRLSTEVCLSPDYHRLLRHGRDGVAPLAGRDWKGWRNGSTVVWVRIDPRQSTLWDTPHQMECGHGFNLRVTSFSKNFDVELGVGMPSRPFGPRRLSCPFLGTADENAAIPL